MNAGFVLKSTHCTQILFVNDDKKNRNFAPVNRSIHLRIVFIYKLIEMILETERLVLRPWKEADATDLYRYAKDEQVGPVAGWPPHKSIEESAEIIRTVFAQEGVYAVTLKDDDIAIGCIGLMTGSKSNFPISESEGEISYWIGVPFWGRGLIPEAMREMIRHGFEDLKLTTLWCGYFEGNEKSKRAQEKCGFRYYSTETDRLNALMDDIRTEHISRLTKEEWIVLKL